MVEELSYTYELEYQKKRNVPSRNISNIEWFQNKTADDSKEALHNLLKKINKEQIKQEK